MQIQIVKIGNSRGIRIPKALLEQTGLRDIVEIEVENETLTIAPVRSHRQDWDERFKQMAESGDGILLDAKQLKKQSSWDCAEWEW